MKNFILLSVLIAITTLGSGQISGSIRFSPDDFQMRDTLGGNNLAYTYFSTNPYGFVETPGFPSLPIRYERFILPFGMEIDNIVISVTGSETFFLDHEIYPAQKAVAPCIGCLTPDFQSIDTTVMVQLHHFLPI